MRVVHLINAHLSSYIQCIYRYIASIGIDPTAFLSTYIEHIHNNYCIKKGQLKS